LYFISFSGVFSPALEKAGDFKTNLIANEYERGA
jgi:hypothetical protein